MNSLLLRFHFLRSNSKTITKNPYNITFVTGLPYDLNKMFIWFNDSWRKVRPSFICSVIFFFLVSRGWWLLLYTHNIPGFDRNLRWRTGCGVELNIHKHTHKPIHKCMYLLLVSIGRKCNNNIFLLNDCENSVKMKIGTKYY